MAWAGSHAMLVPVRIWLAILVVSAGCADHDVEVMTDLKTKICACTTSTCAAQVLKEVPQGAGKVTSPQTQPKVQELARAMMDCIARLSDAERPSTDPDAPGSASGSAAPAPPPAPATGAR